MNDYTPGADFDPVESADPEEREKWLEFYSAVEHMNDETPDGRMPIESRAVLGSIWEEVMAFMEQKEREFAEGNLMLNFPQFKKLRDAFLWAKDLERAGMVSEVKCAYRERSGQPSDIEFHTDRLDLTGALKDRFADAVGDSCVVSACVKLTGGLDFTLRVPDIWIPIPDMDL